MIIYLLKIQDPVEMLQDQFQFKVKLNSYEDYQGLLYYGNHEYGDWGQLFQ